MKKNNQLKLLEEIVETAYRLLINKIANGGIKAENESSFQLEFGYILKTLGQLYEFRVVDKFHLEFEANFQLNKNSIKSKTKKAIIDLLVYYKDNKSTTKAAIELKFFQKKNHREPNYRYDVFKDLSNIELYKENGIDLCYFILLTDHSHYVNHKCFSVDTKDFDFRDGKKYTSGTILQYRTKNPYGPDIKLNKDYKFKWDKVNELYFLKIKI